MKKGDQLAIFNGFSLSSSKGSKDNYEIINSPKDRADFKMWNTWQHIIAFEIICPSHPRSGFLQINSHFRVWCHLHYHFLVAADFKSRDWIGIGSIFHDISIFSGSADQQIVIMIMIWSWLFIYIYVYTDNQFNICLSPEYPYKPCEFKIALRVLTMVAAKQQCRRACHNSASLWMACCGSRAIYVFTVNLHTPRCSCYTPFLYWTVYSSIWRGIFQRKI